MDSLPKQFFLKRVEEILNLCEKHERNRYCVDLCFSSLFVTVLDVVHFYIKSHEDKNLFAYQSGRTITEVEKPIPKIQMTGT